jgi:hypothetical protein
VATSASVGIAIAALPALSLVVGTTRPTPVSTFCDATQGLSTGGGPSSTPYCWPVAIAQPPPSPTEDAVQEARVDLLAAYNALTAGMTGHHTEDPDLAAAGFSPQVALAEIFRNAVVNDIGWPESNSDDVQTLFDAADAYKNGDGNLAAVTAAVKKEVSDLGGYLG